MCSAKDATRFPGCPSSSDERCEIRCITPLGRGMTETRRSSTKLKSYGMETRDCVRCVGNNIFGGTFFMAYSSTRDVLAGQLFDLLTFMRDFNLQLTSMP